MPQRLYCHCGIVCLVLLLCLSQLPCWASQAEYLDPVNGLSADDFVKLVLERNPDLLAVKQRTAEASGLLKQAGLRPNSDLSVSVTDGAILNSPGEREYSVDYTHPFELGGKRDRRIQLASLEVEMAGYEIADRERELIANARTAFIEALAAIRNLNVLRQTFELIQKTNEVTIQRVKEGESPALEEGLISMELNRVKADLTLASSQAQTRLSGLKVLYGADPGERLSLKDELRIEEFRIDLESVLQQASKNRPDLLAARLQEKAADAQIDLAKAEAVPDVNGFAGYTHSTSSFDQFGLNENGMLVPLADVDNTITAGISINLPFGNRNQGNIEAGMARSQAARFKTRALERSIETEVRAAAGNYTASLEAIQILATSVVPQSEKNLQAVRASYELGELRFLDFIQEQRRALEIQNSYTDVWKAYLLSVIQLENATGMRLGGKEQSYDAK